MKKVLLIFVKCLASLFLVLFLAVFATSISPIYKFSEPAPFSGPDIFNPYRHYVDSIGWKRANFHTHTKVDGLLNECDYWPEEVLEDLEKFGYDIVTFSNHNRLTEHPRSEDLQVNVYEHGYNFFKYHKLVFGSQRVNRYDIMVPWMPSQMQFEMDYLGKKSDIIQFNHPFRTGGMSEKKMDRIEGYDIVELDSGVTTEQDYWDWALSAGHYSFALANDDLHHPDVTDCIARRCNWLNCPSGSYEDIKACLLDGCYWSMRIPDFGEGDWTLKYEENSHLPSVSGIGLDSTSVYISLTDKASRIVVTGQDHKTLYEASDTCAVSYTMAPEDAYARFTAYFPNGVVIYSNAFARYDSAEADSPFREPLHKVDWPLTILYNLAVVALIAAVIVLFRLCWRK